ncbi:uncharacterized protein BX664DRAFT_320343 [Halteromyces radiatus]|uniref:uncharacterized protein n=1 Tax=Halteromyces radiatus TaxID=101107 RepID=UPI00221E5DAC|nr:uncharacterized protein BX664DRAFT_320343 [Halteromyces radiatus]KAI8099079.1 hypothetical protein BX664DRAFT_320343 [Halteromyces radiatus]
MNQCHYKNKLDHIHFFYSTIITIYPLPSCSIHLTTTCHHLLVIIIILIIYSMFSLLIHS